MAFIELDYSNPNDDPTLNETNSDVQEGDFDGAFTLAQTLPSLYRMDGDERLLVEDIARADYPYSGSLAKALLEGAGLRGSTGYTCPALPKIADKGKGSTNTKEREVRDFKVTVTPNPASSQATVEYTLPEGSTRAALSVVNTLGEKMTELGLEGSRGSRVVDLHELPAGVYFFVVTDQSGRTSSSKLMIINH